MLVLKMYVVFLDARFAMALEFVYPAPTLFRLSVRTVATLIVRCQIAKNACQNHHFVNFVHQILRGRFHQKVVNQLRLQTV